MGDRKNNISRSKRPIVDPEKFGVSFSIKQCRNFKVDPKATLDWLINEAGFRRFRLMSYWNEIEKEPGVYNFKEIDQQLAAIKKVGGVVTFCLGARQPRWPENHWPDWAWSLPKHQRDLALLKFVALVVERYKDRPEIINWQLENEALLEEFGERPEVDRRRLYEEYELAKTIDPRRPVIMTTSTSWGIPIRKPIPDVVGFSFYNIVFDKNAYRRSLYQPFVFRLRAWLIKLIHRKPSFIHELQCEPWGPKAIWEMSREEQDRSMSLDQIRKNIAYAKQTSLYPIDLWGGEWWFWLAKNGDEKVLPALLANLSSAGSKMAERE